MEVVLDVILRRVRSVQMTHLQFIINAKENIPTATELSSVHIEKKMTWESVLRSFSLAKPNGGVRARSYV